MNNKLLIVRWNFWFYWHFLLLTYKKRNNLEYFWHQKDETEKVKQNIAHIFPKIESTQ